MNGRNCGDKSYHLSTINHWPSRNLSLSYVIIATCLLFACSPLKQISRSAEKDIINTEALRTAHVGISVYEPGSGQYLYNYQGDQYFVPASNIKIPTCYAAMKYLPDSLVAARISKEKNGKLRVYPTGDPSFLHREFHFQPLIPYLKNANTVLVFTDSWQSERWGNGWSWNDYDASYMAERSPLPVFGNLVNFELAGDTVKTIPSTITLSASSGIGYNPHDKTVKTKNFFVYRSIDDNDFQLKTASNEFRRVSIPLRTDMGLVSEILEDSLKVEVVRPSKAIGYTDTLPIRTVYSQPTDSLLKPMMHRSDNFFAEQSLMMVSNEVLGVMNDGRIIDSILKTDFKDLPQRPRWADGSGLSRYNLFTPQDFVGILDKMQNEFGMQRIREILPTGNEGTLTNYYKTESGFIYAKTGTLSGVVALGGYLYTKKNRLLIFSILVNNHRASSTDVRRAVEKFVQRLRNI